MLRDTDLETFVELVRRAERATAPPPEARPDSTLRADNGSDDSLHRNEYARLQRSLKIACVVGDLSEFPHRVLDAIVRDLSAEDNRYLPLTHSDRWLSAIRWAIPRAGPSAADSLHQGGRDRQIHVGSACRRLRDRGYPVHIGTLGAHLDAETRMHVAERIDSLVAQIGGVAAIQGICGLIGATGRVHDGMWLMGNLTGGYRHAPDPAIPVGWLLSIALRHIHTEPSNPNPADALKAAAELAIDFAASMDCQRYNPFDGFALDAPDFLPALAESLTWRELFTLPQVPPSVLPTLRDAFSQIVWAKNTDNLRRDVDGLFRELDHLLEHLSDHHLTRIPRSTARAVFPLLWQHSRAPRGAVNARYLDPFGTYPRDHERYVFFQGAGDGVFVLPPSLTAAAACEAVFRLVWREAGLAAHGIVADTIEKSVAIACRALTPCVWEKLSYRVGKKKTGDGCRRTGGSGPCPIRSKSENACRARPDRRPVGFHRRLHEELSRPAQTTRPP